VEGDRELLLNMNFTFLDLRAAPDGRTGHKKKKQTLIMQSVSTFVVALGPVFARQVGSILGWVREGGGVLWDCGGVSRILPHCAHGSKRAKQVKWPCCRRSCARYHANVPL